MVQIAEGFPPAFGALLSFGAPTSPGPFTRNLTITHSQTQIDYQILRLGDGKIRIESRNTPETDWAIGTATSPYGSFDFTSGSLFPYEARVVVPATRIASSHPANSITYQLGRIGSAPTAAPKFLAEPYSGVLDERTASYARPWPSGLDGVIAEAGASPQEAWEYAHANDPQLRTFLGQNPGAGLCKLDMSNVGSSVSDPGGAGIVRDTAIHWDFRLRFCRFPAAHETSIRVTVTNSTVSGTNRTLRVLSSVAANATAANLPADGTGFFPTSFFRNASAPLMKATGVVPFMYVYEAMDPGWQFTTVGDDQSGPGLRRAPTFCYDASRGGILQMEVPQDFFREAFVPP